MQPTSFEASSGPVAARVMTALAKIGIAIRTRAWREAGPRGLTPTQGQILTFLRLGSGMPLLALAERLGVTAATASEAVRALLHKGLVRKAVSPADGRSRLISLTPRGRREADSAAGWPDFLLDAVDALAVEEQEVFLRGLVKMIRTLQGRGQIPISRMCVTCRFFRPHVHPDARRPHHCAFVDAPFGDRHLRIECGDHDPADPARRDIVWKRFIGGRTRSPRRKG